MADKHESQCCIVCLEEGPAYHFVPCNHKCVCENCAKEYIAKEEDIYTRCPVCRREFDSITSDITRSMMLVGTEEADEEEEDQLQIACALSHSEFVNKIQNDMLQEQLDLCTAISASQAEASKPPSGGRLFSEDEMFQIACALSTREALSKQELPMETIDLTQNEISQGASSVNNTDLKVSGVPEAAAGSPPDTSNLRAIRLTFFAKVKIKTALFARAFRIKS